MRTINRTGHVVTRSSQKPDVLYVAPDGGCFVSPDGEGRFFYDSVDEALEDYDVIRIERVTGWSEW